MGGLADIASQGHPRVREIGLSSLHDSDVEIIKQAIAVLEVCCPQEDSYVSSALSKIIAQKARMSSPRDLSHLLGQIQRSTVKFAALELCFGHRQSEDSHWTVRRALLQALGISGMPLPNPAYHFVKIGLEDPNPDVCEAAVEVLVVSSERAQELLVKLREE